LYTTYQFQQKVVDDLIEEIRKLKAMIVKHENRIRALEAKVTGTVAPPLGGGAPPSATPAAPKEETKTANSSPPQSSGEEMAPDEV
jgi:hypothetical protein